MVGHDPETDLGNTVHHFADAGKMVPAPQLFGMAEEFPRSKAGHMLRALLCCFLLRLIGLRSMPEAEAFAPPSITKKGSP